MTKEFKPSQRPKLTPFPPDGIPASFANDSGEWLANRAAGFSTSGQSVFALIHMDDGVLWGRVENGQVITPPSNDWTPQLRSRTIQQCRVFGTKGELFIWREADNTWRGREVIEDDDFTDEPIRESQILFGDRVDTDKERSQNLLPTFTPIIEVTTGIRQIVPITVTPADFQNRWRVTLSVLHYLSEDGEGQTRILCSRLRSVELKQV
jgi:CRISPR-associated protein (TIGR03984 family)